MSTVVLSGKKLQINEDWFLIEPPLKSSPNDKMIPSFNEAQYTYSDQLTKLQTFVIIWEAL